MKNNELFGRYTLADAKRDSRVAYQAYLSRKPRKIAVTSERTSKENHIVIRRNPPVRDCAFCDGTGTYIVTAYEHRHCLCRALGRQPTPHEIISEFKQE